MSPADIADQTIRRTWTDWSEEDGGVAIRKAKAGRFGSAVLRIFRVRPVMTIRLDALGSAAWQVMDGRTVGEVLAVLEARFPDEPDLPERLGRYVALLASHGFVALDQSGAPQTR